MAIVKGFKSSQAQEGTQGRGSFQRSVGPQDFLRKLALKKTERNNSNIAGDYMGL